jgi:hypothetical protein
LFKAISVFLGWFVRGGAYAVMAIEETWFLMLCGVG